MFLLKIHCCYFRASQDTCYRLDQLIAPAQLQAKTKNFFASALQVHWVAILCIRLLFLIGYLLNSAVVVLF